MNDERFFAWLDGELDPAEAERAAIEVAADPELSAKAEAHRAMRAKFAAAFEPVVQSPVPERLSAIVRAKGKVVDFATARERRRGLPSVAQWAAMAATLALGVVTGTLLDRNATQVPQDAMVASASLGEALDVRLASDPAAAGPRIGITFRDSSGDVCRTFTDSRSQGLACRDGGTWAIRALVPASEGQQGDFRMASGSDPALAGIVDGMIAGEPFDAEQEKAAQANGWR